jgi:DNA-binding MarR family transcriptional regulator
MVIRLCEGRYGITRREWRVLAALVHEAGLLSSELAERVQLDRARTSRAVTSLVAKGLVHRQTQPGRPAPGHAGPDARRRALHDAMFPLVRDLNHELLALLDDSQVAQLDRRAGRAAAARRPAGAARRQPCRVPTAAAGRSVRSMG